MMIKNFMMKDIFLNTRCKNRKSCKCENLSETLVSLERFHRNNLKDVKNFDNDSIKSDKKMVKAPPLNLTCAHYSFK